MNYKAGRAGVLVCPLGVKEAKLAKPYRCRDGDFSIWIAKEPGTDKSVPGFSRF